MDAESLSLIFNDHCHDEICSLQNSKRKPTFGRGIILKTLQLQDTLISLGNFSIPFMYGILIYFLGYLGNADGKDICQPNSPNQKHPV